MKIAFFPYESTENKYVNIIIEILKSINGIKVYPFVPLDYLRFSRKMWGANVVWLNWFELDHGRVKNMLKIFVLILLKVTGKKIIYTLHNRKLHNKDTSILSRLLQNSIYYFCDIIVIHSKISVHDLPKKYIVKTQYIPHPNYIGEYGDSKGKEASTKLRLLFLGQVKPYKNIELLIKTASEWNPNEVELTIAGKPISEEYKSELLNLAAGKNIKFVFEFVKDDEMSEYLGNCDLLVLPYDISSSLNSGTVILAFSYAKTVICPLIGTVGDLTNKEFLTYTYNDSTEHLAALKQQIQKATTLKSNDNQIFDNWGQIMYNEVYQSNSKDKIKQIIEQRILK